MLTNSTLEKYTEILSLDPYMIKFIPFQVALHHLINALCEQSAETMDLAYGSNSREPCIFAVAKLIHVAKDC